MSVRKLIAPHSWSSSSIAAPRKASADWLLTPFVGWNFGGAADFSTSMTSTMSSRRRRTSARRSRWMGAGIVGFEIDFGYTPNFFENTTGYRQLRIRRQQPHDADGQRVDRRPDRRPVRARFPSLCGRRRWHPEEQGRRPRGLLQLSSTDWAFNVGGGAMFFVNDKFGIRGDVRYFRLLAGRRTHRRLQHRARQFQVLAWTVGADVPASDGTRASENSRVSGFAGRVRSAEGGHYDCFAVAPSDPPLLLPRLTRRRNQSRRAAETRASDLRCPVTSSVSKRGRCGKWPTSITSRCSRMT